MPVENVDVMFNTSCNSRNGYFLVGIPLMYVGSAVSVRKLSISNQSLLSAMWILAPKSSDVLLPPCPSLVIVKKWDYGWFSFVCA